MRHLIRRIPPMLQWNRTYSALILVFVLVALSAVLSNFTWVLNFTW